MKRKSSKQKKTTRRFGAVKAATSTSSNKAAKKKKPTVEKKSSISKNSRGDKNAPKKIKNEILQLNKQLHQQRRQLEIEESLEKVRARAMGMNHSDELSDVLSVLFSQFDVLGITPVYTFLSLIDLDKNTFDYGQTGKGGARVIAKQVIEFNSLAEWTDLFVNMRAGKIEPVNCTYFPKESFEKVWEVFGEIYAALPEGSKVYPDDFPDGIYTTQAYCKFGFLGFDHTRAATEEEKGILVKVAREFERLYQRFLDLQKAESQTREAKIENALEKVRSRSLAMHKSEELKDVITVVLQKLHDLDIEMNERSAAIMTFIDDSKDFVQWVASPRQWTAQGFRTPYFDYPIISDLVNARNNGLDFYSKAYSVEEKNSAFQYYFENSDFMGMAEEEKALILDSKFYSVAVAITKFSAIAIASLSSKRFSEQETEILKRLSKVFEQAYIRFLDLQKAEAQAREAQIEAALERIRSRSIAMRESRELGHLSFELVKQVQALGIATWHCAFNIYDEGQESSTEWGSNANGTYPIYKTPREGIFKRYYEIGQKGETLHVEVIGEDKCADHYAYLCTLPGVGETLVKLRDSGVSFPKSQIDHVAYFKYGYLLFITFEPAPEAFDVFKRFAKVFEQTYTRFLDLQKAEAQAREAQIEASLERVRSRSLAMHKSDELAFVVDELFQRLKELEIGFDSVNILQFTEDGFQIWAAYQPGKFTVTTIPYSKTDIPYVRTAIGAKNSGQQLFTHQYLFEEKNLFLKYLFEETHFINLPEERKQFLLQAPCYTVSIGFAKNTALQLQSYSRAAFSESDNALLMRFVNVFEQCYTRFLDLQRAEAQAREARIESSIEKIRSRSLAMHKSDELQDVVNSVFDRLRELEIEADTAAILIYKEGSKDTEYWIQNAERTFSSSITMPYVDHSIISKELSESMRTTTDVLNRVYTKEEKNEWFSYQYEHTELRRIPDQRKMFVLNTSAYTISHATMKHAGVVLARYTDKIFSDKENEILRRIAKAFEHAYIRFLDLQKVEAQSREAQIEASLERVRSKTMAMHNSHDVGNTVATLFDELTKLSVNTNRCGILIFSTSNDTEVWTARSNPSGEVNLIIGYLDASLHPLLSGARNAWKNKQTTFSYELIGDDLINYYQMINNQSSYRFRVDMEALPAREIHTEFYFHDGCVFAFTPEHINADDAQIFNRLAGVFGQTYRRYLDLQKAEAQAREATIEAALEKVRGKAMAMHNSNDLTSTASLVFTELRKLGINSFRSGVGLLTKENRKVKLYSATSSADGDGLSVVGWAMLDNHPILSQTYDNWIRNEDYFPVLRGEELKTYYENIISTFSVPVAQSASFEQFGYFLPFSEGLFYGWSENPYSETDIKILHRFKAIVDLTFRRFMELQKSEANALEAIRQASLDRVRAEIASMRTTSDLDRITPLIWKELNTLDIPFVRCGVFIMDELQEQIHTFLSTPDGRAIAAFHLPYSAPGNVGEILSHWKKNQIYISHWDRTAFSELGQLLVQQGAIPTIEVYMNTVPGDGIHLHCLPFIQGMLYVGNTTELKEDEIDLIQSVADAFATAYARYEDFNKLEAAKQQVDKTLNDLKQTQNQLVISEKMASLGELTAGIAHEIQNPLNFVNNFSEVSNELLKEMNDEIEKGNFSEVKAITEDVRKNLEKILHHGKRADGIVKGMLQHSRTSSGAKELTDINVLADEYLRLAFHGFRAKDKSFNVTTKTDFDDAVGNIPVVPQEIGRVVLNLITNAFYTVSEKKKQSAKEYEPTVTLKTRKKDGNVLISVIDNGNGISPKVLDKIFQPFFTTKPTGQGTGLGLSLSYDIVKAHRGDLVVETNEREGSEFIISLPATN